MESTCIPVLPGPFPGAPLQLHVRTVEWHACHVFIPYMLIWWLHNLPTLNFYCWSDLQRQIAGQWLADNRRRLNKTCSEGQTQPPEGHCARNYRHFNRNTVRRGERHTNHIAWCAQTSESGGSMYPSFNHNNLIIKQVDQNNTHNGSQKV